MKKFNFWDILAWLVLIGILIWLILKMMGFFNTPLLLEYAPVFGAVYLAGWAMHKLDNAVDEIKEMKNFSKETIREINQIKENCIRNHFKK